MSLELRDIRHAYGKVVVLDSVTISLQTGITALLGINGAGKSTLLTIAAGIVRPDRGRVMVGSHDLHVRRSRREGVRRINLMPQAAVFPSRMSAHDIVAYLGWLKGLSARAASEQAREALAQVGLADRADHKFGSLSGGMARRVAFAQAIATGPDVLLLDEPTTGLDPAQRSEMARLIRALGEGGVTVLLSSHVVEDIEDLAHSVIVIHDGRVRFDGSVDELASAARPGTRRSRLEAGFLQCIGVDAA